MPSRVAASLFRFLTIVVAAQLLAAQSRSEDPLKRFKKWLDEDVVYIITDPERDVFNSLTTVEEKEHFIDQFWARRDPTPGTADNEFKEEHYRRIQYANERFAAGRPGWKTDRGRIYVKYGEPNGLERRPTGGGYTRPQSEGGGRTTVVPFELWRYNFVEGVGKDVEIEFVDEFRTGDYRIALSPQQKDALLMVPGAGLTEFEESGAETRALRLTRMGLATSYPGLSKDQPFERMALMTSVTKPMEFRFKDLHTVVEAHVSYSQLPMRVATHYLRVGDDRMLVSIAAEVANSDLRYAKTGDFNRAEVQVYGRITDLAGRTVQEFEDAIYSEFLDERRQQSLQSKSLYQKLLTIKPGVYKLDLSMRDSESKTMGTTQLRLAATSEGTTGVACSPVILANRIEPVSGLSTNVEQFAYGDL
jgi:GWxTD domain-containing protein